MSPEECSICLLEFSKDSISIVTECSHRFHLNCARHWFKEQVSCPNCRFEVPQECDVAKEGILSKFIGRKRHARLFGVATTMIYLAEEPPCRFCRIPVYEDWREVVHCYSCIYRTCHRECLDRAQTNKSAPILRTGKWVCRRCRHRHCCGLFLSRRFIHTYTVSLLVIRLIADVVL